MANDLEFTFSREEADALNNLSDTMRKLIELVIKQQKVNDELLTKLGSYKLYQKNAEIGRDVAHITPIAKEYQELLKRIFMRD